MGGRAANEVSESRDMTKPMEPLGRRLLIVVVTVTFVAGVLTIAVGGIAALDAPVALAWWTLAPIVALGELSVVHGRSNRRVRSFSLSEIPVVIGLYFASPLELLLAVAVGNLLVLHLHRGHRGLRLAFNIAQFIVVTSVVLVVFRLFAGLGSPMQLTGWIGAFAASAVGSIVGVVLVGAAIRATGVTVDAREEQRIAVISIVGAAINSALGLGFVIIAWHQPLALWVAGLPAVIVFIGYRTYVRQLEERAQLGRLYEASLSLHRSSTIEHAVLAAAEQARSMVDADIGAVILFADGPNGVAFLTEVGSGSEPCVMLPVSGPAVPVEWAQVLAGRPVIHMGPAMRPGTGRGDVANGIAVPLNGTDRRLLGVLIGADRVGDVDAFGQHHLELLETLAGMLTMVLEKERLEDSLNTITGLKERLEEAARSKDQFIASISHELRTPLTAVVGLSAELSRDAAVYDQDDLDEFLRLIAQQSAELSYIVEDLLVAARADSSAIPLHPEPVDLQAAVRQVIEGQQITDEDLIPLDVDPAGELMGFADPLRVRQIVRNLLTNATRYGGTEVRVSIESTVVGPAVVVSDDGTGVAVGEEQSIFEPYRRASGGRHAPESVGLGLAVSRQLARSMGGELSYRRRNDRTEFVLELPPATASLID